MSALEAVRQELPEAAKDVRLNLQSVLETTSLNAAQKWGVAIASAIAAKSPRLRDALVAEAMAEVDGGVIEDARAASSLMAMNNVYYRFRHMVGKPSYQTKPPRLRMNRLAQVLGSKADFELMSLAVSAIKGCEACIKAHEKAVLDGGLSEDHVHDAVRIAATVNAAATALFAS